MPMKVECPTCNTVYNLAKPPPKRAAATCKKCGGKIIIDPMAETPVVEAKNHREQVVSPKVKQDKVHERVRTHGRVRENASSPPKERTSEKPKKKTVKRFARLFFLGCMSFFALLTVIVVLTEPQETSKAVVESNPYLSMIQGEPEYQEYLEIQQRAARYKNDLDWFVDTLEFLRQKNVKWQVADDYQFTSRIKYARKNWRKIKLRKLESIRQQIEIPRDMLEDKILYTAFYKKAPPLQTGLFERLESLMESSGFGAYIGTKHPYCLYWTDHKYYRKYGKPGTIRWGKIKILKQRGEGASFNMIADQQGNIFMVRIPLGDASEEIDWANYQQYDDAAKKKMYENSFRRSFLSLHPWVNEVLSMLFEQGELEIVQKKLVEFGKADEAEIRRLDKMKTSENVFDLWMTDFLVGDKSVVISCSQGKTSLYVEKSKFRELASHVDKLRS